MCWKKACILLLFFAVTAIVSPAQTVTTLAAFEQTNGATPRFGSVVQATNGDLYGTTEAGGSNNYGTIFEITPAGVLTTLHSFNLTDGANPTAALVQATNGDLYGTASLGGTGTACGRTGCGTIFKITVAGALTTLYNFDMTDGTAPGFGENLTKGLIDTFGDTGHPVLSAQTVPASDIGKFGILECADTRTMTMVNRFVEKPRRRETASRLASVGRYVITESVLEALRSTPPGKNGEIWLSDAFVRLLEKGLPVAAFLLTAGRWHTVGNPEGYTKAVQAAVRAEHTLCEARPPRPALRKAIAS